MVIRLADTILSLATLAIIIALVNFSLSPFSELNFLGPIAGVATVFAVLRGISVVLSFTVALVVILFASYVTFDVTFTPELLTIGALAIGLQGLLGYQLTAEEMDELGWLSSREKLVSFMLKIGPVVSIISASAVLVLILVTNQVVQAGLFYSFMLNWCLSALVTVFVLPLILFSQRLKQISDNKRYQVIVASVLAIVALAILFRVSQNDYQHKRLDDFNLAIDHFEDAIAKEFSDINAQIRAIHAFLNASDNVTKDEFLQFAKGVYIPGSSVMALEWVPIVEQQNRDAFEEYAKERLFERYFIKHQLDNGQEVPAPSTPFYAPVYHVFPVQRNAVAYGLDMFADDQKVKAFHDAAATNTAQSTQPITLIQGSPSDPGLLVAMPVYDGQRLNAFGALPSGNGRVLSGYALAVVQVAGVIRKLINTDVGQHVNILIEDITSVEPYVLFGEAPDVSERLVETIIREDFGRTWRISITEKASWLAQPRNWLNWGVLIGCAVGGLLYQFLMLLMAAYSSELNRQVEEKTKELILEKDRADKQSKAKSQFIDNLNNELKTPVNALSGVLENFPISRLEPSALKAIEKIKAVNNSLVQSVETLADLSDIESGRLVFNTVSFDFHLFLQQIETMLNIGSSDVLQEIEFEYDETVPQLVYGDKHRLQQLILALVHNAALIFNNSILSLSIKAHRHQHGISTVFIVITAGDDLVKNKIPELIANREFESLTTSMSIAKEICNRLGGAVNLSPISESGEFMLSASFKLDLDDRNLAVTEEVKPQLDLSDKTVVVISTDNETTRDIVKFLDRYQCGVFVLEKLTDTGVSAIIREQCDLVFLECESNLRLSAVRDEMFSHVERLTGIPIVGLLPNSMDEKQFEQRLDNLELFINKPVKPAALQQIIEQYL
ncbi:CHASE domain-containing protein [Thalassotalea euphylliae]|uniref:CHASE domain-containing protein n=1 Tax=Thalassotalea euphylliae TaxID=1655234 RepID=UPI00363B2BC7